MFWFDSNLRRNPFIKLSSELAAPILDRFKKKFVFCIFSIRSFKFWVRRLVSFRSRTVWWGGWFSKLWRSVPVKNHYCINVKKFWYSYFFKIFSVKLHTVIFYQQTLWSSCSVSPRCPLGIFKQLQKDHSHLQKQTNSNSTISFAIY